MAPSRARRCGVGESISLVAPRTRHWDRLRSDEGGEYPDGRRATELIENHETEDGAQKLTYADRGLRRASTSSSIRSSRSARRITSAACVGSL